MLPQYAHDCSGEGGMHDTAMLYGLARLGVSTTNQPRLSPSISRARARDNAMCYFL